MMSVPLPPPSGKKYRNYSLSFKQEAVRLVEAGETQRAVCVRLDLPADTLRRWLDRFGNPAYQQQKKHQFSPALKRQIVGELLDGRLSYAEAQLKYSVRHRRSLRDWVAAHRAPLVAPPSALAVGTSEPPPDSPPDSSTELARQLQHARWQLEALHTLIDYAETTYGIEIRKKTGAKQST